MTLQDQLAGLHDDRPISSPPPGELWERGHRWQRARRRGTALVLLSAAVIAVGLGGLGWQRAQAPVPANPTLSVGLPDRVYAVSPWLSTGTPGSPVIAVRSTERGGWWGTSTGLAAISATTGEYVFLDLPDDAAQGFALSPDGEHVAYWTEGIPSGDPNTQFGRTTTGLAVYDTTTGEVSRHEISTQHGLSAKGLVWADGETLLVGFLQWQGGDRGDELAASTGKDEESLLWRLGDDPVGLLADNGDAVSIDGQTEAAGDLALVAADRGLFAFGLESLRLGLRAGGPLISVGPQGSGAALRADGAYARVGPTPGAGDRVPNSVTSTYISVDGKVPDLRPVPGTSRTFQVLGWRDESTLVLARRVAPGSAEVEIAAVDTRDGTSETLVQLDGIDLGWAWASGLLDAESVRATPPQTPLDPRILGGSLAALVVLAGASVVVWRRHVRP